MKIYRILLIAAVCLLFAAETFAQCGADGTQPCSTKKTPKKATKQKTETKKQNSSNTKTKSTKSSFSEGDLYGTWRFEKCSSKDFIMGGIIINNEWIMVFDTYDIRPDGTAIAYRSEKWLEYQLKNNNVKQEKTETFKLIKSIYQGSPHLQISSDKLAGWINISRNGFTHNSGVGAGCYYKKIRST